MAGDSGRRKAVRETVKLEQINKWLPIQATRQAYKRAGKIRIVIVLLLKPCGGAFSVNYPFIRSIRWSISSIWFLSVADIPSEASMWIKLLVAVRCWESAGEGEIYHGIGRGELNIAGLPVYRDAVGGIGTPTSDEERTKIGLDTTHLLMIINGYSGLEGLEAAGKYAVGLLSKYVSAINMEAELVTAKDRTKIAL